MNVRFATFTLDDGRRQLLEGDRPVHISPKAYELLKLLILRRPNAVSKSEIHEHLWPGTFVSDANLASLVAELRSALGQHKPGAGFIRTAHGFGYAFEAPAIDAERESSARSATRNVWLVVGSRVLPLSVGTHVIGRDIGAAIRLDDLSVSREHARLSVSAGASTLKDLDSKNGTYLRGRRIEGEVDLADGDQIRLGNVVAVFRSLHEPADTATAAE